MKLWFRAHGGVEDLTILKVQILVLSIVLGQLVWLFIVEIIRNKEVWLLRKLRLRVFADGSTISRIQARASIRVRREKVLRLRHPVFLRSERWRLEVHVLSLEMLGHSKRIFLLVEALLMVPLVHGVHMGGILKTNKKNILDLRLAGSCCERIGSRIEASTEAESTYLHS